jgi:NADPH2:quinone reductase
MMKSMKVVTFASPGGPEKLTISEMEIPVPKDEEVLIEVHAAGVNRPDLAQRKGTYPPPPGASPILGLEVSGLISKVPENSHWKVGDQVCALVPGGGYADFCLAPESHVLRNPKGFSFEEAACIPENYFTVWYNVFMIGRLKPNDKFLVHGGSSGIGTTAIQLARAFGAIPFATAGSTEKCKACIDLGAEKAINYKDEDFAEAFKDMNVILDMVGGPYAAKNIDCLADLGRLIQIAVQKGAEATINLAKIMQKRITLTGSTLRPRSIQEKVLIADELYRHVWPLLEARKVKVIIDKAFPMAEVAQAHQYLEDGQHIGKVVLRMR